MNPPLGYPLRFRKMWPDMARPDFSMNEASALMESFLVHPPAQWSRLFYKGKTALGWVLSDPVRMGPLGLLMPDSPRQKLVEHLLSCGADVDDALVLRPALGLSARSLREIALMASSGSLFDLVMRHSTTLLGPRPSYWEKMCLIRKNRLDWVVRAHSELPVDQGNELVQSMVKEWASGLHSQNLTEAQSFLRATAVDVPSLLQAIPEAAWTIALRDPSGYWLEQAERAWPQKMPDAPPKAWSKNLGFSLVFHECPGWEGVRDALKKRLSPESALAWAPGLPSHIWPGKNEATTGRGPPTALTASQWRGILSIVSWSTDWGLSRRAKTEEGVPWPLWILRQAQDSCERWGMSSTAGLPLVWSALERLIRHKTLMKNREVHRGAFQKRGAYESATAHAVLESQWVLGFRMASFAEDYRRLLRALALERALEKREEKERVAANSVPPLLPVSARPRL